MTQTPRKIDRGLAKYYSPNSKVAACCPVKEQMCSLAGATSTRISFRLGNVMKVNETLAALVAGLSETPSGERNRLTDPLGPSAAPSAAPSEGADLRGAIEPWSPQNTNGAPWAAPSCECAEDGGTDGPTKALQYLRARIFWATSHECRKTPNVPPEPLVPT